jgi:lysyl-tRNA synthetase class 2
MARAIQFVLQRHHFRAGRYSVAYQSCDDSTAQAGNWDFGACLAGQMPFTPHARKILELSLAAHVLLDFDPTRSESAARLRVRLSSAHLLPVRSVRVAGGTSSRATASRRSRLVLRRSKLGSRRSSSCSVRQTPNRLARMTGLPKRFAGREEIAAARADAEKLDAGAEAEATRRVAGRVMARRDMGKLVFLDLVDRSGRIQLLYEPGELGELDLNLGDLVGVEGQPMRTRRGEPSLRVRELTLLARIRRPLPDTFHGLTDVEQRYRRRYLDLLMNEESRRDAEIRARMVSAIRRSLDDAGFLEVETPVLQPRYGGAFAEPFVTHYNVLDEDRYLRIATELYLKRLIVGGLEKVYELGKDFRNEGVSFKHNPEFTMLEWYEAYADYRDTMERIEGLVRLAADAAIGTRNVAFRGHGIDLSPPWRRIRFVEALEEHELWTRDEAELRAWLGERGIDTSQDRDWAQLVDHAFSHFVEPSLIQPTIVHDYPIELSPFARSTDGDPTLTERFEYFVGGMELGNAFSEINDADEQAERFAMQQGIAGGEQGDPDYVEALSYGMPPTGGLGLGIDRLAMVLTGRETIRDVILFPALRER